MQLSAAALFVALLMQGHGLVIKDLKHGKGHGAKVGDTVSVTYVGKLTNGHVFDSTKMEGGKPFDVTLGQHHVIAGWEQGLLGMKEGGKRRLTIPPEMGYGARGAGTVIPPNATLIFEVNLLKIQRAGK